MSRGRGNRGGFIYPACAYRPGDSFVHRLHAGLKLLLTLGLILAAVYLNNWAALFGLLAILISLYLAAGLGWRALWRDTRWLLVQVAVVAGLFIIRDGWAQGTGPGLKTGLKILLFFLPSALVLRTSQMSRTAYQLSRFMPRSLSFLLFTSLRFVPFFAREMHEISKAQRLRGARLAPRRLIDPRTWPDVVNCLLLPLLVRAWQTAGEAADSATARGLEFSGRNQPGDRTGKTKRYK